MPLYEFKCDKCGHVREVLMKTLEALPGVERHVTCNAEVDGGTRLCNSRCGRITSLPSPPRFNGSGFYETDYKRPPAASGKEK